MNINTLPNSFTAASLLCEINNAGSTAKPRVVDKPLVLYGAGDLGQMAASYFEFIGIKVDFVVDKNATNFSTNNFWKGYKLLTPDEVPLSIKDAALVAVCIVKSPFSVLELELSKDGWQDIVPFYDISEAYRDRHPLSNGWFMRQLKNEELTKVKIVLNNLADDVSRAHHLQFFAWHYLREDYIFTGAPIETENRYVIPQVLPLLSKDDIYLDVGAHLGEAIIKFKCQIGDKFKKTYAIEGDSKSYDKLVDNLRLEGFRKDNTIVINEVVGETNDPCRYFEGVGYASQKSSLGSGIRANKRIDDLNLGPVTLFKVHVEGWELEVLKGSLSLMQRYRPIIIVTIYHNSLGLWEIPTWLMKNLDKYSYYERLHSWCGTGLVIYCIPEYRSL